MVVVPVKVFILEAVVPLVMVVLAVLVSTATMTQPVLSEALMTTHDAVR